MIKRSQFLTVTVLSAASLCLVLANAALMMSNRGEQVEVNDRQLFIQQTASLEGLYREMVKALADLAVRNNDQRVLEALAAQGFSVTVNPPASPAADAPRK